MHSSSLNQNIMGVSKRCFSFCWTIKFYQKTDDLGPSDVTVVKSNRDTEEVRGVRDLAVL